jgi:hypothetical protein
MFISVSMQDLVSRSQVVTISWESATGPICEVDFSFNKGTITYSPFGGRFREVRWNTGLDYRSGF